MEEIMPLLVVCVGGEMSCLVHYFRIKDTVVVSLCPSS